MVPEIPNLGSIVQWETQQASFPTVTVGPGVWIFLSPLNTSEQLSHLRVPTCRKDKNRTATRRLHAGRTSIRDVIVMLNEVTMSISAYSGFSGSLSCFCFFSYRE